MNVRVFPQTEAAEWRVTVVPGRTLDATALDAMWAFRGSIFALKPTTDPAVDRRNFAAWCTASQVVVRAQSGGGALEGMFVVRWIHDAVDGAPLTVVLPEFIFLSVEARRRALLPWMFARALVAGGASVFRHGPAFLGGFGYPSGAMTLDRFVGPVRFPGEPTTGPAAALWARAFERVIETAGASFRAERGVKDMPTLPRTLSDAWAAAHAEHPTFRRYVARCPDWREGFTPPVLVHLSAPLMLRRLARGAVRRALRPARR